jgi:hypothetical protein
MRKFHLHYDPSPIPNPERIPSSPVTVREPAIRGDESQPPRGRPGLMSSKILSLHPGDAHSFRLIG